MTNDDDRSMQMLSVAWLVWVLVVLIVAGSVGYAVLTPPEDGQEGAESAPQAVCVTNCV
jgi:hypothetical protein